MLRNLGAVLLGLLLGSVVNMLLVTLGPHVIPPPAGVDLTNPESLWEAARLLEPRHFIFPFLAHAGGTFAGALLAHLLAGSRRRLFALVIGGVFLAGGAAAASMIPAPLWFVAADLVLAYLPMAWLACLLGNRLRPEAAGAAPVRP